MEPIHEAAIDGDLERVKRFIKENAALLEVVSGEIDFHIPQRATPLLYACAEDHLPVIEWLIDQGADIRAADDKGRDVLSWPVAEVDLV